MLVFAPDAFGEAVARLLAPDLSTLAGES